MGEPSQKLAFVVDDNQMVARVLRRELVRAGFEVVEFTQPQEVLQAASARAPDVVVTDLLMPDMDGLDLAAALSAQHPNTRVLVVTAGADDLAVQRARDSEVVDEVLLKPWSAGVLRQVIERLMG